MTHITLVCAAGMSTSLLVNKMKEAAEKEGKEIKIIAMSELLLLGPQVKYLLPKMKAEYEPKGMKVALIDTMIYGMMDGKRALDMALGMLN